MVILAIHIIKTKFLPMKCEFGLLKYLFFWVSVSDQNQNSGFGQKLYANAFILYMQLASYLATQYQDIKDNFCTRQTNTVGEQF